MPREDATPDQETLDAIAGLPHAGSWPDIDDAERRRRERVLWEIALRILEDGPRHATPSPERGRQFMPFAALRGYDEMIREVERTSKETGGTAGDPDGSLGGPDASE